MTRQTHLVLLALAGGTLHGYGIVGQVRELSDGAVRLGAGTLYSMLGRLVGQGLVEAAREEVVDGRLRRYYRLSTSGTAALAGEVARQAARARARGRLAPGSVVGEEA
jgi:DNA-binding PadR family transcriptional regulator